MSYREGAPLAEEKFMQIAIEEALQCGPLGEAAVGAAVVLDGEVIGRGGNRVHLENDRRTHAEKVALDRAHEQANMYELEDAVLYSTHEPCPMCSGSVVASRLQGMVFGTTIAIARDIAALYPGFKWLNGGLRAAEVVARGPNPNGTFIDEEFMLDQCLNLFGEVPAAAYRRAQMQQPTFKSGLM